MSLHPRSPPEAICVIRLSAIGDCCHTLPVIRTLQHEWPSTRITWVIGRAEAGLLQDIDDIEFVVFDKSRGWGAYRDLRAALRRRRFDLLLHMHPSMRANFASLLVRADIRLGYDRARCKDYQWLFSNRQIQPRGRQHVMDLLFGFAETLGISERVLEWDIPLSAEDRAYAGREVDADRPTVLISPCANARFRNYRNWSAKNYAAVAEYAAQRRDCHVILTGGSTPLETECGKQICELSNAPLHNLIGQTKLKQLVALLDRATVVICPDSGPAHLATAVGTPVIGLYATTNPERAAPYLSRHLVVNRYPEALQQEYGLSVEEAPWGKRVRNPAAMLLIRPDDVTQRLDEVLDG